MALYEWFKVSSIGKSNTLRGHGEYTAMLLLGHTTEYDVMKIVLRDCELAKPLVHFPKGTLFKQITLNECNIFSLNIYEKGNHHIFEPDGYNYFGRYAIIIDGKRFEELLGYLGVGYIPGLKRRKAQGGFCFPVLKCHEKTGLYPSDTIIKDAEFDFLKGIFTGIVDNKFIKHDLRIDLRLKPEYIPSNYLKEALDKGSIDKSEYKDKVERRKDFKFDVKNPPHIQKIVDAHK